MIYRAGCVVLAGWYLLFPSGTLYALVEKSIPLTKTVENADFPCADHDCGCKTLEQYQNQCCCTKRTDSANTNVFSENDARTVSRTVNMSFLSAFQCSTRNPQGAYSGSSKPNPHLLVTATLIKVLHTPRAQHICKDTTPLEFFPEPEDKIPI
jgi:hypothetical protein